MILLLMQPQDLFRCAIYSKIATSVRKRELSALIKVSGVREKWDQKIPLLAPSQTAQGDEEEPRLSPHLSDLSRIGSCVHRSSDLDCGWCGPKAQILQSPWLQRHLLPTRMQRHL